MRAIVDETRLSLASFANPNDGRTWYSKTFRGAKEKLPMAEQKFLKPLTPWEWKEEKFFGDCKSIVFFMLSFIHYIIAKDQK